MSSSRTGYAKGRKKSVRHPSPRKTGMPDTVPEIEAVLGRAGTALAFDEIVSLVRDQFRARSKAEINLGLARMLEDGVVTQGDGSSYSLAPFSGLDDRYCGGFPFGHGVF